ncbi:MAG TPA: hypothetical protein VF323_06360, partial [Candidatus Limnocylindrales bacterium]
LWGKVLPYWGDPFCAAFVTVWSRFYWTREENRATVQVGWDGLPDAIKAAILARQDEHDDAAEPLQRDQLLVRPSYEERDEFANLTIAGRRREPLREEPR